MWLRFKKRLEPGYSKYHFFPDDGAYMSICKKQVRRTKNQYGRGRLTCPDRLLACATCREKAFQKKVRK